MAVLFHVVNQKVVPTAETLLVHPFSDIWERDKSKDKEFALKEFAYIEFFCSVAKTNFFRQYEENVRSARIIDQVFGEKGYTPDELVLRAIALYNKFNTEASASYTYYQANLKLVKKIENYLNNLDPQAVNPKTMLPVFKPKDLTAAVADTKKVITELKGVEKIVQEEVQEELQIRAQKKISPFANPESLDD